MAEKYSIFPVPLFREFYHNFEDIKEKIVPTFKELEEADLNDYTGKYSAGSYTSFYSNFDLLRYPELGNLKSFIKSSAQEAHESIGLSGELVFTNSWFSINRQHSYHEAHHHCPDIWSGVYYVKADCKDATISFLNKNIIDTGWPYNTTKIENTDYVSSQVTCTVYSGLLIIFPSYLEHKVNQQTEDSERITIAFNMNIK